MYRLSPFTYVVGGMIPTGISMAPIVCSPQELIQFTPPTGQTCGDYMVPYLGMAGGYLVDPENMSGCEYCSASTTDDLLKQFGLSYGTRWRDFGLLWAYVIFNIVVAVGLYWLVRVVSLLPGSKLLELIISQRRRRRRPNERIAINIIKDCSQSDDC
jgi:ATP-binding cassette subfamily G (WHITE) protein 2 (PDR)